MTTTIRIKRSTKKRLETIGHKGQTFDDLINILIENYEKTYKPKKS